MDISFESGTTSDSSEVLKRIQKETQRLRRRISNDKSAYSEDSNTNNLSLYDDEQSQLDEEYHHPDQTSNGKGQEKSESFDHPSIEVTGSGTINPPPKLHYIVDNSTGSVFEDPVPRSNMSSHLKDEHEAFKQRCVEESSRCTAIPVEAKAS